VSNGREQDSSNSIGAIGEAALAVGAGVALFYRSGGSQLLERGVRKADRFLGAIQNDVAGRAMKEFDAKEIKRLYEKHVTSADSSWNKLSSEFDDKIQLLTGKDDLISEIVKRTRLLRNPSQVLASEFNATLKNQLKQGLTEAFNITDENTLGKLHSFVDDGFTNFYEKVIKYSDGQNLHFNKDFQDKHFSDNLFTTEQQTTMMQALNDVMNIKANRKKQFTENNMMLTNNIANTIITDIEGLKKRFGKKGDRTLTEQALGFSRVTLQELVDNKDKVMNSEVVTRNSDGDMVIENAIEIAKKAIERNPDLGDVYVGSHIRKDNSGRIISVTKTKEYKQKIADSFANTLPGKLLKTRDVLNIKDAPSFHFSPSGTIDPILAAHERKIAGISNTESSTSKISNSYVRIHDKMYRINGQDLEHVKEFDNLYLVSGKHGSLPRSIKMLAGDANVKNKKGFLGWADIGTTETPTKAAEFRSIFTKTNANSDWGRNLINNLLYKDIPRNLSPDEAFDIFEQLKKTNKFFNETTSQLDMSTIKQLRKEASNNSKEYFKALEMQDNEMFNSIAKMWSQNDGFKNEDLNVLIKRYISNPQKALESISIISDKGVGISETKSLNFSDMIRKEVAKEAFIKEMEGTNGKNSIVNLFNRAGIKGRKLDEAKYLANYTVFQNQTYLPNTPDKGVRHIESIFDSIEAASRLFKSDIESVYDNTDALFVKQFRQNMIKMSKEKAPLLQKGIQAAELDMMDGFTYGNHIHLQKSVNILEAINNKTKRKAFFKQLTAGRDNMADVTTATMVPYFSVMRLIQPLDSVGLGFSVKNTRNVKDATLNIMLKRVLPVAGGLTALSYIDYRAKAYTGTGLKGATANSLASLDIGARKVASATGVGYVLDHDRDVNPMMQYWFGKDYQNGEERRQYYENGYAPVRQGRYWSFGSASEFRGGKINYFQPNMLKRAHSDYSDIGIYGSTKDKWAHSWIPTPRHPFSTIRRLADPYYLERKHYQDRPYAVTGKAFQEGTPWGAVLNPTIGSIIKPERKMHQRELQGTTIDVRDLIARQNEIQKSRASNKSGLIRIDNTGFTPTSFIPDQAPNDGQRIVNLSASNGQMKAKPSDLNYNAPTMTNELSEQIIMSNATNVSSNVQHATYNMPIIGEAIEKTLSLRMATNSVRRANSAIYEKANSQPEGMITEDSIFRTRNYAGSSVLQNAEAVADLRTIRSGHNYLSDVSYSSKELSGIYGFAFESLFPNKQKYTMQNAGRMNSYSRQFWDSSIGGLGGEFMEIARRFFPHEDHSITRINNIRNTMPSWMPEKFRYGDPYEAIPKGEMRLPGEGYTDLYKLHPDQYGTYGAFDRMKILGDIAPWSREYKYWRDIANDSIKDPYLKKQMQGTKDRVIKQSKQHDFYSYRFLNSKVKTIDAIVDKVTQGGSFNIVGSNEKYKLAGISIKGDINQYLQNGMHVRLEIDKNQYSGKNQDGSINANVETFDGKFSTKLNKKILDDEMAVLRNDSSAAGVHARFSDFQILRGKIYETIAHAQIPYVHDKFLRVNSPLESYKNEQVYGTSYSSWGHPIQSFVLPSLYREWETGYAGQKIGLSSMLLSNYLSKAGASRTARAGANILVAATNRSAVVGGVIGGLLKIGDKKWISKGAKAGAIAGFAGYSITRLEHPVESALNFGKLGAVIGKQLYHAPGKGALVGVVAGLALSGTQSTYFDKNKTFKKWIPKGTRKKWEIEEYYDRLKYVKYTGLYNKAARLAERKEGVDIKRLVNKYEYRQKKDEKEKRKLLYEKSRIEHSNIEESKKVNLLSTIDSKLQSLTIIPQTLEAGEYTRAALIYKQAAEATVYGLQEDASWAQLFRAVPKNERDYLIEFSKEKDPKKQKEILELMSPYQRKVLQTAWKQKTDKLESNASFFAKHKIPTLNWGGWNPSVDLDNVKIKTIKNEGMMLSDFGVYESQMNKPEVILAPEIDDYDEGSSGLKLQANLTSALQGYGLLGVNVSVEPTVEPGIHMITDIVRTTQYKLKEALNSSIGNMFF